MTESKSRADGARIKSARDAMKPPWSQEKLAQKTGYSLSVIQKLEQGTYFSHICLEYCAKALGVSVVDLYETNRASGEITTDDHLDAKDPAVARRAYSVAVSAWAASWRLFESHRSIRITDVYVQEILRETAGGLFVTAIHSPLVPEATLLADVCGNPGRPVHYPQVWSLSGEAGVGKSTLLRQWAVILGRAAADPSGIGRSPLFVPLRHLSRELKSKERPQVTPANLAAASRIVLPGVTENIARTAFEDASAAVFLLDGLDEMDEAVRPLLVEWLIGLPPDARAVVSLRPQIAIELQGLPRAVNYRVCDFTNAQIAEFVRQWFREDPPLGDQFIAALEANPRMREVAAIPLLLTGLCLDAETAGVCAFTTDHNIREVYKRIVAILLAEWDSAKAHRRADPALIEFGLAVFASLALRYPFDVSFGLSDLRAEANKHAVRFGASSEAVDELIRRATATGRLLVVEPTYDCSFAHRAFHDFYFSEGVLALDV